MSVAALAAVCCLGTGCPKTQAEAPPVQAPPAISAASSATAKPAFRFRRLDNNTLRGVGRLTLADLNRDRKLDVVATAQVEPADPLSAGRLSVLLGDGRGAFRPAGTADVPAEAPVLPAEALGRIAAGNLNNDGCVDLALASHDSYNVTLLFGEGDGSFPPGIPRTAAMADGSQAHTHSLAICDINGDSLNDLLSTCADDNAVAVQLGQAAGGFAPASGSPYPAGNHPYEGLSCADVNADGRLDVVVVNLKGNAISVLLGDGTGRLAQAPGSPLPAGERPGFSATGDLDGDGHIDIVASHDDFGILAVYYGDSKGGFTAAPGSPFRSTERAWHVAIADVDSDGRAELLTGDVDTGDVCIRAGARYSGSLPEPQRVPTGLPQGPQSAGGYFNLGDLNGDGRLDIVASHWDTGDAVVLLQE